MNPHQVISADEDLDLLARRMRLKLVEMSHAAKTPHLGSALSCVEILIAAYWGVLRINPSQPNSPGCDRFILSKGHAASALYVALAYRGFFPREDLDDFASHSKALPEQPAPGCAPGVDLATGSLGHGLPVGAGMALSALIQGSDYKVFVVMSDGECNEGSVWEAAMFAPSKKLENLLVIIDYNKWQATGRVDEVMSMDPLVNKWKAFGWNACEVDGHDINALRDAMNTTGKSTGKPTAIIAHTTKGKGVSFMEDDNNWHYRIPNLEEVNAVKVELGLN